MLDTTDQQHLIEFIKAELKIAETCVRSAELARNSGSIDHQDKSKELAAKALEAVRRALPELQDQEARDEIKNRLTVVDQLMSAI